MRVTLTASRLAERAAAPSVVVAAVVARDDLGVVLALTTAAEAERHRPLFEHMLDSFQFL